MALCHESLENFYKMQFSLMEYHDYTETELNEMLPFEREIYVNLLIHHLDQEKERLKAKT